MKRVFSFLLVALLIFGLLPVTPISVGAAEESASLSFSSTTNRTSYSTTQQVWEQNGITFTNDKASSTTNVANYSNPVRLYASSTVTITHSSKNITKIVFTSDTTTKYITALKNSLENETASSNVITVAFDSGVESLSFTCSGQIRLTDITVYYEASTPACEHTNTEPIGQAVEAGCESTGMTAGEKCSDCGEILEEQKVISALGHNYEGDTCTRCGDTLTSYTVSFSVPGQVASVESQTGTEGSTITLPSADNYTGKYSYTFVGWAESSVSDTATKPTLYSAGSQLTLSENIDLYAVYTYAVAGAGGASEYVLTELNDIAANDVVVITMTYTDGTIYALSSSNGTSKAPAAPAVKDDNGDGKLDSTPADELKWNIDSTADGYIIYVNGSNSTWLYCTGTNNGVRVGNNTANTFVLDAASGYLKHQGTSRYLGVYRTTPDWRCYTNTTGNTADQTLGFYVLTSGEAEYYTSTLLPADDSCAHSNTTEVTVDPSCTDDGSVTVTCNDCGTVVSTTVIDALGHTVVTDAAVAATCVNTGLTEGSHCSVCDTVIVAQETVPATGVHNYVDGVCTMCNEAEPSTGATRWELVTDASQLNAGDRIVIVALGYDVALSETQNGNNRSEIAVTKDGNTVGVIDGVQILVLQSGNVDNTFALYTGEGYLYAASSGSNYLRTESTLSDNSSWIITIAANGAATVKAQGSNTRNWLRYNSSSKIFSCYASGQQEIAIYKEVSVCGHENTVDHDAVAPTCSAVGYTAGVYCNDCESYIEGHEVVDMIDHSYGEGVVTTAPGCTSTGLMTYTCTACGSTKTESIDALGHQMDEGTVVDPTCTVAGSKTYTCSACGQQQIETIPASGHSWSAWTQTKAPSCTVNGEEARTCGTCGETETQSVAALGHSFGQWTDTIAPTCSEAGTQTRVCATCGETETQPVAALGHDYNSDGICNNCGEEILHYELVTDYTKILAGGQFVLAIKLNDTYYALHNDAKSDPVAVDLTDFLIGEGANMAVIGSEDVPVWKIDYYSFRTDCFSLYSAVNNKYLAATDSTSFASSDSPWAWTFIDSNNDVESDGDNIYAVDQGDGSKAFVVASATIVDRAISLRSASSFANYSVRDQRNREVYFFKVVNANTTSHTVNFVENGQTVNSMEVDVAENVIVLPDYSGVYNMPEGYSDFLGWVTLPHTESLVAPTTIYGAGDTFYVTENTTLYALFSREDANAEGQAMSYHLVTDNNQLVQDQMYIIVGYNEDTDTYYAMSKDQLSGDRGASVVVPDSNGIINFTPSDNVAVLKLTQGYEIGSFAFLDVAMNKFLYCASTGSQNALKSQAELSADSSFIITITSGENGTYSIMIAQSTDTTRTNLAYNTISDDSGTYIFSCYDPNATSVELSQTYLYVGVPNSTYATYYTTGLCNHQWGEPKTEDATCEHAGYTLYICVVCGEIKMENIQAHGHTVGNSTVTTAPTCTTTGIATSYCTACNKEFTEILSVVPHTETVTEAVGATCTETGLTEGTHCSVCLLIMTAQQQTPALGHNYTGHVEEIDGVPTLIYQCSRCSDSYSIMLKFAGSNITLENSLIVGFFTNPDIAEAGNFTDIRVEFEYGNRVGENKLPAIYLADATIQSGKYKFPCRYITPSQIGDTITATLYGTYEGVTYTYQKEYSVAEYCYTQLEAEESSEKLKTLLVNLLYYCDYARAYTGYKVNEDLVTAGLTEAQKAMVLADRTYSTVLNSRYEVIDSPLSTWKGASLVLYHATKMQISFTLAEGIDISTVTAKVLVDSQERNAVIKASGTDPNVYIIVIDDLKAREMSSTVLCTLYQGDTVISNTAGYSVESYVYAKHNDKNAKLADLVKAMIRYGDAARAYFN